MDKIISKPTTKEYEDNYDRIFKKDPKLSLDELYTEIHSGDTPETKPKHDDHTTCHHWVVGWEGIKET